MNKILSKVLLSFGIAVILSLSFVIVTDMIGYAQNSQRIDGLNFEVPEDWPIEKRNGVLGPIPIDEYVSIKFKAIEEEFQKVKDDLSAKFDELKVSLESTEKKFSEKIKDTQTNNESQGNTAEDLSDITSNLSALESEVGRLNRKLTSKVTQMQDKSDSAAKRINAIEQKIDDLQTQIYKLSEEVDYLFDGQKSSY